MWSGTFTGSVIAVVSATWCPERDQISTSLLPAVKPAMPAAESRNSNPRLAVRTFYYFPARNFALYWWFQTRIS